MANDAKTPARASSGRAEFFLGPMFSEKTTTVGRLIKRARLGGLNCVFVKYAADVRYGAGPVIYTHDGTAVSASPAEDGLGGLRVVEARTLLRDVALEPDELDIGVDEGQFYPDLRWALDLWMREGRRVYVAALDGDFRRNPFPPVAEALPLATHIEKLTAVCMICAGREQPPAEASYTARTVEATAVELIGARDKYKAACLACYLAHQAPAVAGEAERQEARSAKDAADAGGV